MGWFSKLFRKRPEASTTPVPAPVDLEALAAKMASVSAQTWIPVTEPGDGAAEDSKFSGLAFIPEDGTWPSCAVCQNPMQLFLQLAAKDLPPEAPIELGADLVQFFYCTYPDADCEDHGEGWDPERSRVSLVRGVPTSVHTATGASPVKDAYPARRIVGWTKEVDHPDSDEAEFEALVLSDAEASVYYDRYQPITGDKLAGWPDWVQGTERPSCPDCGETMQVIFQVDSEKNIPWMWGDSGVGHITQCPNHRHVLRFGWACC